MIDSFGKTASGLARNPLGIIALFIVLVYGFACLLTAVSGLSPQERAPLIYFAVGFPVLVLAVFAWLVTRHSTKLFAPSDFRDESNYMQLSVVAALTAAKFRKDFDHAAKQVTAGKDFGQAAKEVKSIVETVRKLPPTDRTSNSWRNHVLWVDDRPDNNAYERNAFEAYGLRFTLALSTAEALERIKSQNFAAIISDMGRAEGPREGYVLLDTIRKQGNKTPLFFYASSKEAEHVKETLEHEGQGCTNDAQELFLMVTKALIVSD